MVNALQHLQALAEVSKLGDPNQALETIDRILAERSLLEFIRQGWRYIAPNTFEPNWHIEAICEHLEAVARGDIRHLLINVPPRSMKSISCSVAFTPWIWAQRKVATIAAPKGLSAAASRPPDPPFIGSHIGGVPSLATPNHLGPQTRFLCASYGDALSLQMSRDTRNLLNSPWYAKNWPALKISDDSNTKTRFDNSAGGYRIATSVGGSLTGFGGDIIIVDDAHNVKEVESEITRKAVIDWWSSALSTRLNDPRTGSFIVVMQRVHEGDLAGHILDNAEVDGDWTLLRIPMEYEPVWHCSTRIGWEDPRGLDENGERVEGIIYGANGLPHIEPGSPASEVENALMWPERFGRKEVDDLKRSLGSHTCTPQESPVLMSDLSLKKISDVKVGDEVVGIHIDTNSGLTKRGLKKAKVLGVYEYMANVVKVKLRSGKTIRCTPEHKWYMGRTDKTHPLYRVAKVGRNLMRVCDDVMPSITPEQERIAGWVSGFFDGDGSASECKKNKQKRNDGTDYRSSCQISFHQTAEGNLPICDRLEEYLKILGFSYNVNERKKLKYAHWQKRRQYSLTSESHSPLPLMQKFIHVVKPTKWVERITNGAYTSKFILNKEKIVSIEPDGFEKVYALETETGNYVVWGLASSNSAGQLQQRPMAKGGAIIKEEYWQLFPVKGEETDYQKKVRRWDEDAREYVERTVLDYPLMEYVIAFADTAYTEKEENDYSACAVVGVWRDKKDMARLMLMRCWQDRLELNKLVHRIAATCQLSGGKNPTYVDRLIIENKASGKSVAQEIKRLFGNEKWVTETSEPRGDKVARAHSIQYLFEDKMVYTPAREWSDLAIAECAKFPKGNHDDLPDSIFGAIRWLRDNGYIEMRRERVIRDQDTMLHRQQVGAIYDV